MKQLQCNFTTPEQSKRLLELGVPIDSADCYLTRFGIDEDWEVKVLNNVKYSEIAISNQEYCLPCWSVGRLIEIYSIITGRKEFTLRTVDTLINEVIYMLNVAIKHEEFDFSKLED